MRTLLLSLSVLCLYSCSYKTSLITYRNGYVFNTQGKMIGNYSNGYIFTENKILIGYYFNGYICDDNHNIIGNYANGFAKIGKTK